MLKNLLLAGAAATGLMFAQAAMAAPILVVDTFNDPLTGNVAGNKLVANAGQTVYDHSTGAGILDNSRELTTFSAGPLSATAQVNGGFFSHNNDVLTAGTSLLRWDGSDTNAMTNDFGLNAGAGYNLSAAGTSVHINVLEADLTGSSVELRLYTDAGNFATASVVLPAGASDHFVLLSSMINQVGALDLSAVRSIELFINGGPALDIAIDFIDVVPEPLTMTVLGSGLLGLALLRRRRKA